MKTIMYNTRNNTTHQKTLEKGLFHLTSVPLKEEASTSRGKGSCAQEGTTTSE